VNYLAHLFLAGDEPESLVGALLGDFVKGAAKNNYPPKIQYHIELHRRIDAYTDAHPIVRGAKTRIAPARRRFAGILLDIFYDHYLVQHWNHFSEVELRLFTGQVYAALQQHQKQLPERLQRMLPFMMAEDWLGSYGRLEWIELTLQRMARRLTKGQLLADGSTELQRNYAQFERDFLLFFPDLRRFVQSQQP
jgi:acyl carrier protein phosphodiesterase